MEDINCQCETNTVTRKSAGAVSTVCYFTLFGLAFLVTSIVYLVDLTNFEKSRCILLSTGSLVYVDADILTSCGHLNEWKVLAEIGILYGALWIVAAPLTILFWSIKILCGVNYRGHGNDTRLINPAIAKTVSLSEKPDKEFLVWTTEKLTLDNQNLEKRQNEVVAVTPISSSPSKFVKWTQLLKASTQFVVRLIFFLALLLLPMTLLMSLVGSGVIKKERDEDSLYFPALALSATCALDLVTILVAYLVMIFEQDENSVKNDKCGSNFDLT